MKLTVLVDNNSLIDSYFLAEPALSLLIEEPGLRVLFDAGYSDAFLVNARRKGLDLLSLDWVALSHGHLDHTWGLDALIRHSLESASQGMAVSRPRLLAHPQAFLTKRIDGLPEIGMLLTESKLSRHFELVLTGDPVWLSDTLVSLGEIPRSVEFELPRPLGRREEADGPVPDNVPDDTALAHVGADGLTVISGCAHAGICNTVERARRVTGVDRVRTVIGGFHLQNASASRLEATAAYLGGLDLDALYPCHCTDLAAKIALAARCPVREVGSGMEIDFS
jgi:7,8-dihydropterin-6-yl-methyl-4-(beta-D-ribofuranosyl)aminobenzene 5'-phosphate synthase